MGVCIREMPDDAARSLDKPLREAGLTVVLSECMASGVPDVQGTEIRCRRGKDEQIVWLYPHPRTTGEQWIMIPVPWSLRPWVSKRRRDLHLDVVDVIDGNGGHSPFSPPSHA
jgi:hypothetical protein